MENAYCLQKKFKKKLSVRQVENLVRFLKNGTKKNTKSKDPNILKIENELTDKIGMNVLLNNKKHNSGTVILSIKVFDQLDRLIDVIKKIINY